MGQTAVLWESLEPYLQRLLKLRHRTTDERIASPSALHPSQPETPTGDLFGYGSDAGQLGLGVHGHMEESTQVPAGVAHV